MAIVFRVIGDFPAGLDVRTFHDELAAISFSSTPTVFQGLTHQISPGEVRIEFSVLPDATDTAALDAAISAHTNTPPVVPTEDEIVRTPLSGDLSGTLPTVSVVGITDNALTSHPTGGPFVDGEFLRVVGGNIVTAGVAGGTDENVKVSGNDSVAGPLLSKLTSTAAISLTEIGDGGDEDLQVGVNFGTGAGLVTEGNDARLSDPRIPPDFQSVVRTTIVNTTSDVSQVYTSLTTPLLTGAFQIVWSARVTQAAGGNGLAEVFLQRAGGTIQSGLDSWRRTSTSEVHSVTHSFITAFSGVSHTFELRFRTTNPATAMSIVRGEIQFWRVV